MNFLPEKLSGAQVIHADTSDPWAALGPGGNEAGFIVYVLPAALAKEIDQTGLAFFDGAGATVRRPRVELVWSTTPLTSADDRFVCRPKRDPSGDVYIGADGILHQECGGYIDFATRYRHLSDYENSRPLGDEADNALSSENSFYAFTSMGLLLVDPSRQRAYFAWRG